ILPGFDGSWPLPGCELLPILLVQALRVRHPCCHLLLCRRCCWIIWWSACSCDCENEGYWRKA
ncbi:hypothetical protein LTR16_010973, partial [Cryomyces antarcticus]